jgi:acetyltransferase-like isoleucine patch superfamily enzyme
VIRKIIKKSFRIIGSPILSLRLFWDRLKFHAFYKRHYKKIFGGYGENIRWGSQYRYLTIPKDTRVSCPGNIFIGDGCQMDEYCHLMANPNGKLIIGNNVRLANGFIHIGTYDDVIIEDNVLISAFVQIVNGYHGFSDPESPIMYQPSFGGGKIHIKSGTWIGRSAHILGGVTLGKNCVIAANAVVTKSMPDHSVAAGIPAKEIKKRKLKKTKTL